MMCPLSNALLAPLLGGKRAIQTRWDAARAFAPAGAAPVLIYQMGKVGLSSVYRALRQILHGTPVLHVHFLSPYLAEHRHSHRAEVMRALPYHFYLGAALRRQLLAKPQHPVKIISLVRDPLAFELSNLLQNPRLVGGAARLRELAEQPQALRELLQQRLAEGQTYLESRFDREMREVFGIDVFAQAFDSETGWQIYRHRGAQLLLIPLEDLSAQGPQVIQQFLGLPEPLSLATANERARLDQGEAYRRFRQHPGLSREVLNQVYQRRFAQHFYSDAQRRDLVERWQGL